MQNLSIDIPEGYRRVDYSDLFKLPEPISQSYRRFPIHHEYFASQVIDGLYKLDIKISEAIYFLYEGNIRFFGLLKVKYKNHPDTENNWILALSNANDGTDGASIYGGVHIEASNCVAFHEELQPIKKHTKDAIIELSDRVSECLEELHEHWNLISERENAYKAVSLTRERAHDIICEAIYAEIVAGREINSLLNAYHNPLKEFKPRTIWSLFNSIVIILNKLKYPQLIERTTALHAMFDSIVKLKNRPSPYVQSQLFSNNL